MKNFFVCNIITKLSAHKSYSICCVTCKMREDLFLDGGGEEDGKTFFSKKKEGKMEWKLHSSLRLPTTDTVYVSSKHSQSSLSSNRNGLSRIYFYVAFVPFLFLHSNQFAKSPFSSPDLYSRVVARLNFPFYTSHPTSQVTNLICHRCCWLLLPLKNKEKAFGLVLKWHLLVRQLFPSYFRQQPKKASAS